MKLKSQEFSGLLQDLKKPLENFQNSVHNNIVQPRRITRHSYQITPIRDQEFKQLEAQLKENELLLPDDAIQNVIRSTVERDFLNSSTNGIQFTSGTAPKEQGWIRISRLPISPLDEKQYAMFPRWQNAIATMHNLQHRLCYVLLRQDGETQLYLGAIPTIPGKKGKNAKSQLAQAVAAQMPGIGIETEESKPSGLAQFSCCGAVTGIPSVRKITEYGEYQTMDQIAMGLRDNGDEQDFAVVVVADPIPDSQIVEILRVMENLGSEVHGLTQYTKTDGKNTGASISLAYSDGSNSGISGGVNAGIGVSSDAKVGCGLLGLLKADIKAGYSLNGGVSVSTSHGTFSSTSNVRGSNVGTSETVSLQYISKSAMYCEALFDKHIERMKSGRSMGFWKTGVYVLAESITNVETIMGMLRAVYSGDDTYIEPIRTTVMPPNSGADVVVRQYQHLPFPHLPVAEAFGSLFEDYATPMTTEELSIATSLPRRDVPGLRLIRNASRFATNPPIVREKEQGGKPVNMGDVLDTGAPTYQTYRLDLNQLVRHTLVAGTNGSGKTNTCKSLLGKVQQEKIPFLVIEPAKTEYLDWALQENARRAARKEKKIRIFAPGYFGSSQVEKLHLNPFQPTAVEGSWINIMPHLDRFKSALVSCMPMGDVLPLVMEETLYEYVNEQMSVKKYSMNGCISPLEDVYMDDGSFLYPQVGGMIRTAAKIISTRGYAADVQNNIKAAVHTRIKALLLGWKKDLFNAPRSTDLTQVFEDEAVINLSYLSDDKDKALVMSILLIALWEYRESKYNEDKAYKKQADANQLMHLTLIEEAHRLMPDVREDGISGMNAQHSTAKMFSHMLSEIRALGEGMVIVDQVPTRLIPDAVKNTNLKIIHRLTAADDIRSVSTSMRLRPDQEAVIGALQPGEAIVCSDFDDAAAWVKMEAVKKN